MVCACIVGFFDFVRYIHVLVSTTDARTVILIITGVILFDIHIFVYVCASRQALVSFILFIFYFRIYLTRTFFVEGLR